MISDPILTVLFGISLSIVIIGLILKTFKQPHVITYILSGLIMGPSVLGFVKDQDILLTLGNIGVILLMFFVGMEVSLPKLLSNWKIVVIGPILQVIVAFIIISLFGKNFGWSLSKCILIAFVITIGSTAVIVKLLKYWGEYNTKLGQDVLGILIVQDIMVAPMLIILNMFSGGGKTNLTQTIESTISGVIIIFFIIYIIKKRDVKIPFEDKIKDDPEIFIFLALIVCFGLAILTSLLGLSSALGAFIAGLLVAEGKHGIPIKKTLESFYLLFVAIFFVSIGMILDIRFIISNIKILSFLIITVFILSTTINAIIIKLLGCSWRESLYAGGILSQLGEFGFVIAATGFGIGILTKNDQMLIVTLIALTLILSPFWIKLVKTVTRIDNYKLKSIKDSTIRKLKKFT